MNDTFELVAGIVVVLAVIALILFIVSMPLALIGFILLLAVSIFTDVAITYLSCVVLGLATIIIGGILKS